MSSEKDQKKPLREAECAWLRFDKSLEGLKDRINLISDNIACSDQWIEELAMASVCPEKSKPDQPYEVGMVNAYKAFGRAVLSNLFIRR